MGINLRFSPSAVARAAAEKLGLIKPRRPDITGLLAANREQARIGHEAAQFLASEFKETFHEYLQIVADKMWQQFEASEVSADTYFYCAKMLKEVVEYPYLLVNKGQKAEAQLAEWTEAGLTDEVAEADRYVAAKEGK